MSDREITYREALGEALREALERDERVVLMGQDIGIRGGAFGVTAGLLEAFGPTRVRDAPSSEAALVGIGIGAALAGLRPVVELTTASYGVLALDQLIHHAAPLRALSGDRLTAPLVVRTPQGGGARLGPIHSQTLEALLHHIPGLVVAVPATAADAKGLLAAAIHSDDPVVVLEHTALYDTRGTVGEDDVAPLGRAVVRRAGSDVSIVASSRMAVVAAAAAARLADEHGVDAEVIDLRAVRPLDHATIAASVRRTGRAVIVEEGWPDGGIGATLAARVAAATSARPVARVTGADIPMPYARTLEQLAIPDEAAIVAAVLKLLGPRSSDGATDHTMSTEIDMEALLAARRTGTPLADAISTAIAPLLTDAAIVLPDGTVTLMGTPRTPHPTATLTFGPTTTRPTARAGAVTIRHLAPLTVRITATPTDAETLFTALRARLEGTT
ncbi:pyruvate dehydrogenase complex E1 component subunit beta [Baekduia sp.]|uniref:alpha-ketoacid dehydrogenase subunit beta n=1 Tax=Baekduia sp. TaxID=2600305 RepID=UPI002DF7AE38|nr:pyruvate dehydrogenase complex E1 component subunit beta [Baekduia sp.]